MKVLNNTEDLIVIGKWEISLVYGITKSPKRKVLSMEPRLSKLLYYLCLNINSNVSRAYLVENIWNDTVVNEESLTRAVSDLRKLLNNNFKKTFNIKTIRGRGYRLDIKEGNKLDILKSRLNPNIGYAILFVFSVLVIIWSIGSLLGLVHTKFLVNN